MPANLQLVPERHERTRRRNVRNRLPMVHTFKGTERLDANFEEGTINIVEQHKANKGTEGLTGSGKRPIGDQIEFGLGRTIAIWSDVVANILNPVGEEFTLLQLEGDTAVLHKDRRTYTLEVRQKSFQRRRP